MYSRTDEFYIQAIKQKENKNGKCVVPYLFYHKLSVILIMSNGHPHMCRTLICLFRIMPLMLGQILLPERESNLWLPASSALSSSSALIICKEKWSACGHYIDMVNPSPITKSTTETRGDINKTHIAMTFVKY